MSGAAKPQRRGLLRDARDAKRLASPHVNLRAQMQNA